MSVSKLESLPNEILTDIFEKYIDGIDTINAFAFQLNRRFDILIIRCRRLRFDFIRCHKDDFRFCMGLLPAYIDKIEELALSEQNTPGQVHAFLSFYPSFDLFKQLRKLYFHIDARAVQPMMINMALRSLIKTSLHTLCIEITNDQIISSLNYIILQIFCMKTLKKFSLMCNHDSMKWTWLSIASSNIEYLKIDGISCELDDLEHILRCASNLKYLDIRITQINYENKSTSKSSSKDSLPQMSMLHTFIFKIKEDYETLLSKLQLYLRCMPSLHRLEINMQNIPNDLSVWETLLENSVPTLTHFNLKINIFYYPGVNVNRLLETVQTPFWIKRKNFNVIITIFSVLATDSFDPMNFKTNSYGLKQSVHQRWIGPRRTRKDNLSIMNKTTSLTITAETSYLLQDHYFDNVNHLVIEEFTDDLFKLITTHVNCSHIKHLDVVLLNDKSSKIFSFLSCIKNITSLQIKHNLLFDKRFAYLRECNHLKFLDISADQHNFREKQISIMAKVCPNIEHLIINTQDLQNVPLLQIYLPRLRSLTFVYNQKFNRPFYDNYEELIAEKKLRPEAWFLFQCESNKITIWIDESALQNPYWKMFNSSSQQSTGDSWFNKLVNKVTSAFK